MKKDAFSTLVYEHYKTRGRHSLPWRLTRDPYAILVSEIMLQQTQADRVIPKYTSFLKKFPTVESLAGAKQADVLREWKGLGYNRRGLNLKRAAQSLVRDFKGVVPRETSALTSLPGVGPYTASAVQAFAFNIPSIVIETNIRTVYIKHFFEGESDRKVRDSELLPLIEETLDRENPREWYAALMDYGAHIKRVEGNFSRRSKLYGKQSKFRGSNRENRSHILGILLEKPLSKIEILALLPDMRTEQNLDALVKEGFLTLDGELYSIKE